MRIPPIFLSLPALPGFPVFRWAVIRFQACIQVSGVSWLQATSFTPRRRTQFWALPEGDVARRGRGLAFPGQGFRSSVST